MARCEGCPLASETNSRGILFNGEGVVRLFSNGALDYLYLTADGYVASFGQLTKDAVENSFPELQLSIDSCHGAETSKEPKPGFLGKLGLRNSVKVCPGVARVVPYRLGDSVKSYFDGED